MIQDLCYLPTIGTAISNEFTAITFPMELLYKVNKSASTLGFIYLAVTLVALYLIVIHLNHCCIS